MAKKELKKLTDEEMIKHIKYIAEASARFNLSMEEFNSLFPPKTKAQLKDERDEALKFIWTMKEKIRSLVREHKFTNAELYPRTKRHSKRRVSRLKTSD